MSASVPAEAAPGPVVVRGGASREEIAAVLAAVTARSPVEDGYQRWRRTRLAAIAADLSCGCKNRS